MREYSRKEKKMELVSVYLNKNLKYATPLLVKGQLKFENNSKTEVFEYKWASVHPGSPFKADLLLYKNTDYKPSTCGVPQGSGPDPLFFL